MSANPHIAALTGEEYLKSLRDGRQVYIDGEMVEQVRACMDEYDLEGWIDGPLS